MKIDSISWLMIAILILITGGLFWYYSSSEINKHRYNIIYAEVNDLRFSMVDGWSARYPSLKDIVAKCKENDGIISNWEFHYTIKPNVERLREEWVEKFAEEIRGMDLGPHTIEFKAQE